MLQAVRLAWMLVVAPSPLGAAIPAALPADLPAPAMSAADPFFPGSPPSAMSADASGLVLYGIRMGPDGSAILGDAQGLQHSYRVGETLEAGATLVEIATDHVVILANGIRSTLRFAPAAERAGTPAAVTALPSAAPATAPAAGVDPQQLLSQAGLQPRMRDERISGYTLIPRGDAALLRQAGLEAGDVLMSVNGQALTPERYAALAQELAGQPTIDITFERAGEIRSISLQAKTP